MFCLAYVIYGSLSSMALTLSPITWVQASLSVKGFMEALQRLSGKGCLWPHLDAWVCLTWGSLIVTLCHSDAQRLTVRVLTERLDVLCQVLYFSKYWHMLPGCLKAEAITAFLVGTSTKSSLSQSLEVQTPHEGQTILTAKRYQWMTRDPVI